MGNDGVPTFSVQAVLLRKVVPGVSFLLLQLFALRRLIALINRIDAVILEVRTLPALFPFLMIRRLGSQSPALLLRMSTNTIGPPGHLRTFFNQFVETLSIKLSAKFFDKIFFISPMMAQYYSAWYGIPKSKIAVWPSAVDTSVFKQRSKASVDRLREEIGLSDRLTVLYHGVLGMGRGVMEMVQAFKILSDESVNATLVVLGDGPAREEISKYVRENGMQEVVRLRRPVSYSEVPDYIAACDVGIISLPDDPRWRYQCPLKLLEYLALNKPVIVSNIPCNTWIVGNAPVGIYLRGTSPREIADGVRAFLLCRNTLHPSLGRQIAAAFSVEKIAEMLEREITSVVR